MTKEALDHTTLGKRLAEIAEEAREVLTHVQDCLTKSDPVIRQAEILLGATGKLRVALDVKWYEDQASGTAPSESPYFAQKGTAVPFVDKKTKTA